MVKLVWGHSCVLVRFPAGPRVRLKTVDKPKRNGLGQKKNSGSAAREETGAKASRTLERPDAMVRWLRPAFGRIAQRSLRVLGEVAMRKLFLSHQSPLGFRQVDPHALMQHVPLIKTLEFVHLVE